MTSSLASPQSAASLAEKASRPSAVSKIFAFAPLWLLIYVSIAAPTYFEPLAGEYPDILGVNLGVIVDAIAVAWMLIGVGLLWGARSVRTEAIVFTVFTMPATALVAFSPAIVLILLNQG
jgi:hypothetical protein